MNRSSFAPDEWYHCYSRGVDKRKTFESERDYSRFIQLLYLCNSEVAIHRSDLFAKSPAEIFDVKRGTPLVVVGAYSLMPNHFHFLLQDKSEEGGGISRFMQKMGTAYTMYFNIARERVGSLFVKPFRSKHVADDRYLKHLAQYIHLNPLELFEPGWKEGKVGNWKQLEQRLLTYPFGSLPDFESKSRRPERALLDEESISFLKDGGPALKEVLEEAAAYYRELSK